MDDFMEKQQSGTPRPSPTWAWALVYPQLVPIPVKPRNSGAPWLCKTPQQMIYSRGSAAGALGGRERCNCKAKPLSGKLYETFP